MDYKYYKNQYILVHSWSKSLVDETKKKLHRLQERLT